MKLPEIIAPSVSVTITYGLDSEGDMAITEHWENHEGGGLPPMVIMAGMLTMAQQSLTLESADYWDSEDDDLENP